MAMLQESLNDIDVRIKTNYTKLVLKTEAILIGDIYERFAIKKNKKSNKEELKEETDKKKNN